MNMCFHFSKCECVTVYEVSRVCEPPHFSLALCFFSSLSLCHTHYSWLHFLFWEIEILSASAHSLPLMLQSASVWCKSPLMTSFKTAEVFKKWQFKNRSSSRHTYVMPKSCIMLQKKDIFLSTKTTQENFFLCWLILATRYCIFFVTHIFNYIMYSMTHRCYGCIWQFIACRF